MCISIQNSKFFNNPKITRFEFLLYFKQKLQESNASEWHVTNSNKIHTQTKFSVCKKLLQFHAIAF